MGVADSVWDEVLDTEHVRVLRTYVERGPRRKGPEEKGLVIVVEPDEESGGRCPRCGQRGPVAETDVVRWRTLDVHGKRAFLEYALPRIVCPEHGKITAGVPWARHDDRFSRPFEEFAAWKAGHMAWSRAAVELRISWQGLAGIVARVVADASVGTDRLEGLRRIGIDEKSWGKGAGKFLVIVTDHDTGRIAWVAQGRDQATVHAFFDALGEQRARLLTHVSADGADWIHPVVKQRAPQAEVCLDAFHIVKWANERLDELRTRTARELRAAGKDDQAAVLGKGLWAWRKKPTNLTGTQRTTLASIAADNKQLYKGYLLKEQLREALTVKGDDGKKLLRGMIAWAHRCRIPEFVKLANTLSKYRPTIDNTLDHAVSNGRAEALNAQINALITRARGFRTAEALIASIHFTHGGLCPETPWP